MGDANVLGKMRPLSKSDIQRIVATTVHRLVLRHGKGTVADAAGCSAQTISNAMSMDGLIELHRLANLLILDPSAFDELHAAYGIAAQPVAADVAQDAALLADAFDELHAAYGIAAQPVAADVAQDAALLADMAGATAVMADAMSDGRVCHRERAEIVENARPLIGKMAAMVARFDRARGAK